MSMNSADVASGKDRRHTVATSTAACVWVNCCEPREDGSEGLTALPRQELATAESRHNSTSNVGAACKNDNAHRVKKPPSLYGGDTAETTRPENLPTASDKTWTYIQRRVRGSNGTGHDGYKPRAKEPRISSVGDTNGATDGRMLSQTTDDDRKYGEKRRELQPRSSREAISASRRQVPCYTELAESSGEVGAGDKKSAKQGGISPQTPTEGAKDNIKQRAIARAPRNLAEPKSRSSEDEIIQLTRRLGTSLTQLIPLNCDLKPSKTLDKYWLYEMNFLNNRMNSYPDSESGKWMTFHPVEELDEAWARAKHLYRSGQLPEINSLKVATGAFNPAYADKDQGTKVICFYCGPASNKPKMLRIGRQVAQLMDYQAKHIAYRSDEQTLNNIPGCVYKVYRRR